MTAVLSLGAMLGLLLAGVPIAFALIAVGMLGLYMVGGTSLMIGILDTTPLSAVSAYELLTIPMFVLMAQFIVMAGIADDLFRAATVWTGRIRGGLAVATALVGAIFGAVCGSSAAAAATLSATTIPAMDKRGYDKEFSSGVVAISGTLAMLIPPSVLVLIYAIIAEASISRLLIATIIPSLVIASTIVLTIFFLLWLDPSRAPEGHPTTWREKFGSLGIAGPMLLLIFCVMGVIYLGVATPTEASGLGAAGAFMLTLAYRRMSWSLLVRALMETAGTTVMILLIIMASKIFGYFITITQITQGLVATVGALDVAPWVILACIIVLYLILGALMDSLAIITLTVPILLPLVTSLGYDPIFFGVIVIIVVEIGLVTPPFGLISFIVAKTARRPVAEVFKGIWPHFVAHILAIIVLCAFPQLILWLPSRM
jgi:tripartite ATP-independent transporter DctM subunit